ncbi:MAG: hypothetical protein J5I93_18590 [Pirellulaceae bacterium]|nr:hypothetical protein [Pirellulaceae bacterium]
MASTTAISQTALDRLARRLAQVVRDLRDAVREAHGEPRAAGWLNAARVALEARLPQPVPAADLPSTLIGARNSAEAGNASTAAELSWVEAWAALVVCGLLLERAAAQEQATRQVERRAVGRADLAGLPGECVPGELRLESLVPAIYPELAELSGLAAIQRRLAELERLLKPDVLRSALDDLRRRYATRLPEAYLLEWVQAELAAGERRRHGAYYTPAPLVGYVVRSVDWFLEHVWGLPYGVACLPPGDGDREGTAREPSTLELRIVDPACGTGVFPLALLDRMRDRCPDSSHARRLLSAGFLDRLAAVELQPLAAAVARHLLQRRLVEVRLDCGMSRGIPPGLPPAWPVCQGNALEHLDDWPPAIAQLHRGRQLPVIVGNPPYANFGQGNRFPGILALLNDYKHLLGERKLNLNDDLIKFIRWAQYQVERAGQGIVALVTSNTFLSGLTHRQMRRSLLSCFDRLYLLDLHGDRKRDRGPGATAVDENVFPRIQQGVAICFLVKTANSPGPTRIWHHELWGSRQRKLGMLAGADAGDTPWRELPAESQACYFVPRPSEPSRLYDSGPGLDEMFRCHVSGLQTKRDAWLVDRRRGPLAARMRSWCHPDSDGPDGGSGRVLGTGRKNGETSEREPPSGAARRPYDATCLRPYMVAPLDFRWLYYDPDLLGRPRWELARHLLRPNLALVFMRQSTNAGPYDQFLATTELVSDRAFFSAHGAPFFAPLYLYPEAMRPDSGDASGRECNWSEGFIKQVTARWQLRYIPDAQGDLRQTCGPLDLFHYAYALFHSTDYRQRYAAALRTGFPRLPILSDLTLVRALCRIGRQLVTAHTVLPESWRAGPPALPAQCGRTWQGAGPRVVARGFPRFEPFDADGGERGRLWLNPRCSLAGVEREAWLLRIGGHQVLARWLKSRRRQRLSAAEQRYALHLAGTLWTTATLIRELDELRPLAEQ